MCGPQSLSRQDSTSKLHREVLTCVMKIRSAVHDKGSDLGRQACTWLTQPCPTAGWTLLLNHLQQEGVLHLHPV